jgi:hypothetical protein
VSISFSHIRVQNVSHLKPGMWHVGVHVQHGVGQFAGIDRACTEVFADTKAEAREAGLAQLTAFVLTPRPGLAERRAAYIKRLMA